ncbi:MAG: ribonuclease Z [Gemmatimonadota bacterium]
MRLTIVGSGTLLPDDGHRSAGHLLEWEEGKLLLDCGSGVLHGLARDGLDWRGITHVALSHFHTDHVGDLAPLLWAWTHGVPTAEALPRTVLGPPGLRAFLDALAAAYGSFVHEPGGILTVVELEREGSWEDVAMGLRVRTYPARHTPEAVVLRVEVGGRDVGYTGDTGPGPALGAFFRGVDVLVSECAVADGSNVTIHLSPFEVAALAREAAPGRLILTHLYPGVPRESLAEVLVALGVSAPVTVVDDGFAFEL